MIARREGYWEPDRNLADSQSATGNRIEIALSSLNSTQLSVRSPKNEAVARVRNRTREIAKLCVQEVQDNCSTCANVADCGFLESIKSFQAKQFNPSDLKIGEDKRTDTLVCEGEIVIASFLDRVSEKYLDPTNHSPSTESERQQVLQEGINYLRGTLVKGSIQQQIAS